MKNFFRLMVRMMDYDGWQEHSIYPTLAEAKAARSQLPKAPHGFLDQFPPGYWRYSQIQVSLEEVDELLRSLSVRPDRNEKEENNELHATGRGDRREAGSDAEGSRGPSGRDDEASRVERVEPESQVKAPRGDAGADGAADNTDAPHLVFKPLLDEAGCARAADGLFRAHGLDGRPELHAAIAALYGSLGERGISPIAVAGCVHEWTHHCKKCGTPSEMDGFTETERSSAIKAFEKIMKLTEHDSPIDQVATAEHAGLVHLRRVDGEQGASLEELRDQVDWILGNASIFDTAGDVFKQLQNVSRPREEARAELTNFRCICRVDGEPYTCGDAARTLKPCALHSDWFAQQIEKRPEVNREGVQLAVDILALVHDSSKGFHDSTVWHDEEYVGEWAGNIAKRWREVHERCERLKRP